MIDRGHDKKNRRDQHKLEQEVLKTLESYNEPLALGGVEIKHILDSVEDERVKNYLEPYRHNSKTVDELANEINDYSPMDSVRNVFSYGPFNKISELLKEDKTGLKEYMERG